MEIWHDVYGYEGLYQISNNGNIKSIYKNRMLKPATVNGYKYIVLHKNNTRKNHYIHRLVLENFLAKSILDINHIDGKKDNNHITNLEYCSKSYNMKHAFIHGLNKPHHKLINEGRKSPNRKLKESDVIDIFYNKNRNSCVFLSKQYSISESQIRRIQKGQRWRHLFETGLINKK